MFDRVLEIVAPHHCYSCGKLGKPLCIDCKYYIESEPFGSCVVCLKPIHAHGVCASHRDMYDAAWCIGERSDILAELINAYKFSRVRSIHRLLAELLDATIAQLPTETVLVPIPTIAKHIRQRGYDHTRLIAAELAQRRDLTMSPLLERRGQTVQFGAARRQRIEQAERAFCCDEELSVDTPYVLIDDVFTTGATMRAAARVLKEAGAAHVSIAVISRQPLD